MRPDQPSEALTPALCIATGAVLLGLVDWPYGYFVVLRWLLCGISLFLLLGAKLVLEDWEKWLLGAFAVLYNPLLPIHIGDKVIWVALNVVTLALFWWCGGREIRDRRAWQREAAVDKAYADAYHACLAAGGTKHDAYVAAMKAIGRNADDPGSRYKTG